MLIELLPAWLAKYIPIISLIAVGIVVEKHYVSRVSTFTNSLALVVFALTHEVSWYISLYADIGLLLGLLGFFAYYEQESLFGAYYDISALFYSSLPVGAIVAMPELHTLFQEATESPDFWVGIFLLCVFAFNALLIDSNDIYKGANPVHVNEFIRSAEFRFPGERRWYRVSDWFNMK